MPIHPAANQPSARGPTPEGVASGTIAPGPLSHEHIAQLNDARKRAKKIRRAAGVAAVSGWSLALFAALTAMGALFGDVVAVILGLALAALAFNELKGGTQLRHMDPRGASRLALNQVVLGALIVAYSMWSLYSSLHDPKLAAMSGGTGDAQVDATLHQLSTAITWGLYGGLAVFGVIGPGLTAWYYHSRGPIVRRFVSQTPPWVVEAMRASG